MYRAENKQEAQILLIEDNPADVRLIELGLAEANHHGYHLSVVEDGEQAMDFLHRRGRFKSAPHPDLILLDLNLPRKGGMEVLAEAKADPNLRRVPVIVLTSSRANTDVNQAYQYGANSYIRKPADLNGTYDLIRSIEHYWLDLAVLPNGA